MKDFPVVERSDKLFYAPCCPNCHTVSSNRHPKPNISKSEENNCNPSNLKETFARKSVRRFEVSTSSPQKTNNPSSPNSERTIDLKTLTPEQRNKLETFLKISGFGSLKKNGQLDSHMMKKLANHVKTAGGVPSPRNSDQGGLIRSQVLSRNKDLMVQHLQNGADPDDPENKTHVTPLMLASREGLKEYIEVLLEYGADINRKSHCGATALMEACQKGSYEIVELLVNRSALVDDVDNKNWSPITYCASIGNVRIAKFLLSNGGFLADPEKSDGAFDTPLSVACARSKVEFVKWLLSFGLSEIYTDDEIQIACHRAVQSGKKPLVKLMLENGAKPTKVCSHLKEELPLCIAAAYGHKDIAEYLLKTEKVPIDNRDGSNMTPLMHACQEGKIFMVKWGIENKANINAVGGKNNWTPICYAVNKGHTDIVKLLIDHGADATLGGEKPILLAVLNNRKELIDFLIFHVGVDPAMPNSKGDDAVSYCAEICDLELMLYFLAMGCSTHTIGDSQMTPLMRAARKGKIEIVNALLAHGSNANLLPPEREHSALSLACGGGYVECVKALLENGADPKIKLKDNDSCLIQASKAGNPQIVEMLLKASESISSSKGQRIRTDEEGRCEDANFVEYDSEENSSMIEDGEVEGDEDEDDENYATDFDEEELDDDEEEEMDSDEMDSDEDSDDMLDHDQAPGNGYAHVLAHEMHDYVERSFCSDESDSDAEISAPEDLNLRSTNIPVQGQFSSSDAYEPQTCVDILTKMSEALQDHGNATEKMSEMMTRMNTHKSPNEMMQTMFEKFMNQFGYFFDEKGNGMRVSDMNEPGMVEALKGRKVREDALFHGDSSSADGDSFSCGAHCHDHCGMARTNRQKQVPTTSKKGREKDSKIDVNSATENDHTTALLCAAQKGNEEVCKLLLESGATVETRDKRGWTALGYSAERGHANIVELLCKNGADTEVQMDTNQAKRDTALTIACYNGRLDVVKKLLNSGAAKEHRNSNDYTPLSVAALNGHVDVVELLLRKGAEINARTNSKLGISPLMLASMNGHTKVVKLLLQHGSDINAHIETNRNSALTLAAFQGRPEVVRLLADNRANLEWRSKNGLTPLMEAANGGFVEVGKILIEKQADVNAPPVNSTKDTALTIAADKGHKKFVDLLVQAGAQIEAKNKKGCTALWLACNAGHEDVVKFLISYMADVDAEDNRHVTCIMAAFRKGHENIVKQLVERISHYPNEIELDRVIKDLETRKDEEDLVQLCTECKQIILEAKRRKEVKADKEADKFLEELEREEREQEEKRAKKREKKKQKQKKKVVEEPEKKETRKEEKEKKDAGNKKAETKPVEIVPEAIEVNAARGKSLNDSKRQSSKSASRESKKPEHVLQPEETKAGNKKKGKAASTVEEVKPKNRKDSKANKESSQVKESKKSDAKNPASEKRSLSTGNKQVDAKQDDQNAKVNKKKQNKVPANKNIAKKVIPVHNETSEEESDSDEDFEEIIGDKHFTVVGPRRQSIQNRHIDIPTAPNVAKSANWQGEKNESSASSSRTSRASAKATSVASEESWEKVAANRQKKVKLSSTSVSRVIGKSGCNINAVRQASGAYIEIEKNRPGASERMVTIKGTTEGVNEASRLIKLLVDNPDVDVDEIVTCRNQSDVDALTAAYTSSTSSSVSPLTTEVSQEKPAATTTAQPQRISSVSPVTVQHKKEYIRSPKPQHSTQVFTNSNFASKGSSESSSHSKRQNFNERSRHGNASSATHSPTKSAFHSQSERTKTSDRHYVNTKSASRPIDPKTFGDGTHIWHSNLTKQQQPPTVAKPAPTKATEKQFTSIGSENVVNEITKPEASSQRTAEELNFTTGNIISSMYGTGGSVWGPSTLQAFTSPSSTAADILQDPLKFGELNSTTPPFGEETSIPTVQPTRPIGNERPNSTGPSPAANVSPNYRSATPPTRNVPMSPVYMGSQFPKHLTPVSPAKSDVTPVLPNGKSVALDIEKRISPNIEDSSSKTNKGVGYHPASAFQPPKYQPSEFDLPASQGTSCRYGRVSPPMNQTGYRSSPNVQPNVAFSNSNSQARMPPPAVGSGASLKSSASPVLSQMYPSQDAHVPTKNIMSNGDDLSQFNDQFIQLAQQIVIGFNSTPSQPVLGESGIPPRGHLLSRPDISSRVPADVWGPYPDNDVPSHFSLNSRGFDVNGPRVLGGQPAQWKQPPQRDAHTWNNQYQH